MKRSEEIGQLAAALAKAQGQMQAAKKDAANAFLKNRYADLAAIVEAIKGPLAANELAYAQGGDMDDSGALVVETLLMHSSGEWISSHLRLVPAKPDLQGIGSAMSYGRRYGLQALVGVPADDEGAPSAEAERETAIPVQDKAASPRYHKSPSDAKPDDWAAMQRDFTAAVAKIGAIKPTPEAFQAGVKKLAMDLGTAGIDAKTRHAAYDALTGQMSGLEMTPAQVKVLMEWAKAPARIKALGEWWLSRVQDSAATEEQAGAAEAEDPTAAMPLL